MTFEKAYPIEKQRQVEEHLRKVWSGEIPRTFSSLSMTPGYRQMSDMARAAEMAAENILSNAQYPGYNVPRVVVDYGTVSTAEYWGGKVHLPVGGCLSIEPIIHDADDSGKFSPRAPEDGDAKKGVELFRAVCKRLGTERLYCSTIDFQGPLTTAALLWEQTDFMVAMYTEPEKVHALLSRITDHLIETFQYYIKESGHRVCGNLWPYIWLPDDIGVGITEDYMPLLSAEMYREFGIPYVERISKAFGGLFIHCCGEYEHQIENLKNAEIHLLGLEFHYPHTRPEVLFEAFGNSTLFVPYISPKGFETFSSRSEYFRYLRSVCRDDTRLWFILDPDEADYQEQLSIVQEMIGEPLPGTDAQLRADGRN